jgi:hypothetical protein
MLDTATAVYEAVEPIIIWKTLFGSLKAGLDSPDAQVRLNKDGVYQS